MASGICPQLPPVARGERLGQGWGLAGSAHLLPARRFSGWLAAVAWGILMVATDGTTEAQHALPGHSPMAADATLRDVFFLDPDRGWAVGDHGTIWATRDGGVHWNLQASDLGARLDSVYFTDESTGWVVGGRLQPYTHRSQAVVLRTRDGGQRWTPVTKLTLPALQRVVFADDHRGWALGDDSHLYPTGLFQTTDGGRSWTPLVSERFPDVRAGHLSGDGESLLLAGGGELARARGGKLERLGKSTLKWPVTALTLDAQRRGFAVGQRGRVAATRDAGETWQDPVSMLPALGREFDFLCVAQAGEHCWVAGSPGTHVFHTADLGRSWETFETGQSLPLCGLHFWDDQRGWAVGALGTILGTRDGGRTWRPLRKGGERIALLTISPRADAVPWELVARYAADEGYLTKIDVLFADQESPPRSAAGPAARLTAAAAACGASFAELNGRFPSRQPELLFPWERQLATWGPRADSEAALVLHAVRQIRIWRPDVLVFAAHSADQLQRSEAAAEASLADLLLRAIREAADPAAYPALDAEFKLPAWQVKKAYRDHADAQRSAATLVTSRLAARLGMSIASYASRGRGLWEQEPRTLPTSIGYQLLYSQTDAGSGQADLFRGIPTVRGRSNRRESAPPATSSLDGLGRIAQRQRLLEQLILRTVSNQTTAATWLGQIEELTAGLGEDGGARLLFQLAQRYRETGRLDLAAEIYARLLQKHPEHPLAETAGLWALAYYASSEATWAGRESSTAVTRSVAVQPPPGTPRAVPNRPGSFDAVAQPARQTPPPEQAGDSERNYFASQSRLFAARATALSQLIRRHDPTAYAQPQIRFPLAAAHRRLGLVEEAAKYYRTAADQLASLPWRQAARCELAEPGERLVKLTASCPLSSSAPPLLDGKLDDSIWEQAPRLKITSNYHDDTQWPATALIACDQQYLYLGVHCRKVPAGYDYEHQQQPRPRDPELHGRDRVEFFLDIDRDYQTYYQFVLDHRGWVAESCLGNKYWNPTWYVSQEEDAEYWAIEAAIPLRELVPDVPVVGTRWCLGVQRTVPGMGFQAWNRPAAIRPLPVGFGLLQFVAPGTGN